MDLVKPIVFPASIFSKPFSASHAARPSSQLRQVQYFKQKQAQRHVNDFRRFRAFSSLNRRLKRHKLPRPSLNAIASPSKITSFSLTCSLMAFTKSGNICHRLGGAKKFYLVSLLVNLQSKPVYFPSTMHSPIFSIICAESGILSANAGRIERRLA